MEKYEKHKKSKIWRFLMISFLFMFSNPKYYYKILKTERLLSKKLFSKFYVLGQFLEQNHWNIGRKSGEIRIFSKSRQLWDAVTFFLLKRFQKFRIFLKGLCLFFQFPQCYGIRARWWHPPMRINIRNFEKIPFSALLTK